MNRRSIVFVSPQGVVTPSYLRLSDPGSDRREETDSDREHDRAERVRYEEGREERSTDGR